MEPETTPQAGATEPDGQEPTDNDTGEIAKLREEAKRWRLKLRETERERDELKPLADKARAADDAQKSDAQKAVERAAELERQLAEKDAAIARSERLATVTRLAAKAGVDLDLVPYLDLSKLDLDDEKAALEVLGKLAAAKQPGSASNPGRNGNNPAPESNAERWARLANRGQRTTIFGG